MVQSLALQRKVGMALRWILCNLRHNWLVMRNLQTFSSLPTDTQFWRGTQDKNLTTAVPSAFLCSHSQSIQPFAFFWIIHKEEFWKESKAYIPVALLSEGKFLLSRESRLALWPIWPPIQWSKRVTPSV